MLKVFNKVATSLATGVALSVALAIDVPKTIAASLAQQDLFFGRNIPGGGEVTEEEFQTFVDSVITPRFPAGLTIFNADGQFRNSTGTIIDEKSKVVTLFLENTLESKTAVNEIVAAYLPKYNQESVLQVFNRDDLKVGFGAGENLIDNDPVPEFIRADLFFGRNIPGGGEVSEERFQTFVDSVITPRFPAGLTVFDADGQFRNSTGTIVDENSKVITLLFEDIQENEDAIDQVISTYIEQFNQESVLLAVNEDIAVSFSPSENLIDNDPVPEFIRADLFFGRNIPDGGEVSEEQFQAFVDSVITPRFPAGLTAFDADGQFRDSTGTIIDEKSKVISLLFEDIQENEDAINEIISSYIDQFNQESVLAVVDEDIHVTFTAEAVPEPSYVLGLLTFGTMIVGFALKKKRATTRS